MKGVIAQWTPRLVVLATVVSIAALWMGGGVKAFNPQPDPPGRFAPLGLTANESARLNAANTKFFGESSERPCAVALRIFDSAGNLLKQDMKFLRPRQTAFLDVTGSEALVGRDTLRTEIWAAAEFDVATCPSAHSSLELMDNATMKTLINVSQ